MQPTEGGHQHGSPHSREGPAETRQSGQSPTPHCAQSVIQSALVNLLPLEGSSDLMFVAVTPLVLHCASDTDDHPAVCRRFPSVWWRSRTRRRPRTRRSLVRFVRTSLLSTRTLSTTQILPLRISSDYSRFILHWPYNTCISIR